MYFYRTVVRGGIVLGGFWIVSLVSCRKFVQINPPTTAITVSQVFADSIDATSAVTTIYSDMITSGLNFGSGQVTLFTGLSGDELVDFDLQYQSLDYNILTALNGITNNLWEQPYGYLYAINNCIQSIPASTGISATAKSELVGEAEFLRAFCYFYLVNFYGDVPLILGTDYTTNATASRTPSAAVYQQVISDLKDAQTRLPSDYSLAGGQPVRANQAAATALLARVYLYTGDVADAATEATAVINNPAYSLVPNLNNVFLAGSSEAILQLQLNINSAYYNATPEGVTLLPGQVGAPPSFCLSSFLLSAFESGDGRYAAWVDSVNYGGWLYYAYKYKVGAPQIVPGSPATECYMVLRLAEQYLIRAEAEANGSSGGVGAAIADLNVIRNRANLLPLPDTLNPAQVIAAVAQERRIELFAEWGHRWLDLKRTKAIDSVMTVVTPLKGGGTTWASYQQLYPVPVSEIANDHNLTQNPNY